MNARQEILSRLSGARHFAPHPGSWPYSNSSENLVEQFSKALTAAKGEVFTAKNLEQAWNVFDSILADLGVRKIIFNQDPPLSKQILQSKFDHYHWIEARGGEHDLRQVCLGADAGLTGAAFALAETGSVGISSGTRHSRMVSLLPPVHIVLLSQVVLVPDLISWERCRPQSMPSQVVIISGPSKTADIEQTLVVGAHGPKRLVVMVYGEE